jgi:hypothetical protein
MTECMQSATPERDLKTGISDEESARPSEHVFDLRGEAIINTLTDACEWGMDSLVIGSSQVEK